jgi:hypothetical protein
MAFFSIVNKLRLCDVTLTNNANRFKTLSDKKTLLKKILYETRPHKLEIGLFKLSLNYTYPYKKPSQTIQRMNTLQCNNIHHNTVQFRKDFHYNPILQRFDTIQTNAIHNACDTVQYVYKLNSLSAFKCEQSEQNETVQQSEHIQQSVNVQPSDTKTIPCDTLQLYNFSQQIISKKTTKCQFYVLMPLHKLYIEQAQTLNIKNISVTTALSDTFLQKYTNRPLKSTKNLLTKLFATHDYQFANVKLYVACVSYCPFEGPKNTEHIIQEILYYNAISGINEICLADTYGGLQYKDFAIIIEGLVKQMDMRKLSVRLCIKDSSNVRINQQKEYNIAKIIQFCMQNNIYQFDVVSEEGDDANENVDACKILNHDKLYDSIDDYAELAYYA